MAVSDPGAGPTSLLPVSNKLQSKLNLLKEVVERNKTEVRRVGGEMRSLITKKESEIIRRLDDIWDEVNARIDRKKEEIQKKIGDIEIQNKVMVKSYEEMKKLLKDMNQTLAPLPQLSEAIESAKREFDISIPYLKLSWRSDAVKESINRMCVVEQVTRENAPFRLQWSKCERGKEESQLDYPCGIAINSVNGNIYVISKNVHQVHIFSKEGEWIKSLKDEKMIYPKNILIQTESLYIMCNHSILILNALDEIKESSNTYDFLLRGICFDGLQVYVGSYTEMKLIFFTQKLTEEKQITLTPQYCKSTSKLRDMTLAQDDFYVLFSDTEYPVQTFSKGGLLTRCVVQKDIIRDGWYFCLDQQLNLIVSDRGDSKIKIISNEGKLLNEIPRHEGEFKQLSGVAVDELGRVVVVDRRQNDILQTYSPL